MPQLLKVCSVHTDFFSNYNVQIYALGLLREGIQKKHNFLNVNTNVLITKYRYLPRQRQFA